MKNKVCIKTKSTQALFPFKGLVTKHTTVKWPIERERKLTNYHFCPRSQVRILMSRMWLIPPNKNYVGTREDCRSKKFKKVTLKWKWTNKSNTTKNIGD